MTYRTLGYNFIKSTWSEESSLPRRHSALFPLVLQRTTMINYNTPINSKPSDTQSLHSHGCLKLHQKSPRKHESKWHNVSQHRAAAWLHAAGFINVADFSPWLINVVTMGMHMYFPRYCKQHPGHLPALFANLIWSIQFLSDLQSAMPVVRGYVNECG